jgi:hypothetical protein
MLTFLYRQIAFSEDTHFNKAIQIQQRNSQLIEKLRQRVSGQISSPGKEATCLEEVAESGCYVDRLSRCVGKNYLAYINPDYDPSLIPYSVKSHLRVKGIPPSRGFSS